MGYEARWLASKPPERLVEQMPELTRSAVHEAGHVVVAYALGRSVFLLRMGSQAVPKDHPHWDVLEGSVSGAESRFGPSLAAEISQTANSGASLTPEHIEWLRAELVTCLAGRLAELQLLGDSTEEGWLADAQQASVVVGMLGFTSDADGGEARLNRAGHIAEGIIAELAEPHKRVANTLSEGPCELDEEAAHDLLERSGVTAGLHRHLLDALA